MCARKWNWILEFGETGLVFTDGSWCPDGSTEPSFQGSKSRPPFTRPSPGTEVLSFPRRTPFLDENSPKCAPFQEGGADFHGGGADFHGGGADFHGGGADVHDGGADVHDGGAY